MGFSGLESYSKQHLFESVTGTQSHEPAWHLVNESLRIALRDVFGASDETSMRTTIAHRHTKSLCTAYHNISAHIARRFEQGTS